MEVADSSVFQNVILYAGLIAFGALIGSTFAGQKTEQVERPSYTEEPVIEVKKEQPIQMEEIAVSTKPSKKSKAKSEKDGPAAPAQVKQQTPKKQVVQAKVVVEQPKVVEVVVETPAPVMQEPQPIVEAKFDAESKPKKSKKSKAKKAAAAVAEEVKPVEEPKVSTYELSQAEIDDGWETTKRR